MVSSLGGPFGKSVKSARAGAGQQLLLAVRHERAEETLGGASAIVKPARRACVGERLIQLLRRITPGSRNMSR